MKRLNNIIANALAQGLSSMALFWVLTILIFSTLLIQEPVGAQGWILFIVSIFFQGVALPVLAFVSNAQGDRMESLLRETHDTTLDELRELRDMHEELHQKYVYTITCLERLIQK